MNEEFDSCQFRLRVTEALARVETSTAAIAEHMRSMNVSIKELFHGQTEIRNELGQHIMDCPLRQDIKEVERKLISGDHPGAREVKGAIEKLQEAERIRELAAASLLSESAARSKTSKVFWHYLTPIIYLIGAMILVLMFQHSSDMLKVVLHGSP